MGFWNFPLGKPVPLMVRPSVVNSTAGVGDDGGQITLANRRVQVAQPAEGSHMALGVVGTAYPAVGGRRVVGLYVVDPDDKEDLVKVEGLLFSEAELEPLP